MSLRKTSRRYKKGSRRLTSLLNSALNGVNVQVDTLAALPMSKSPSTHRTGRCAGPRVGLDRCGEKYLLAQSGFEPRTFQSVAS
jgi:hypothetical protein